MINLEAEVEVVEAVKALETASKAKVEVGKDNLSTKPSLSAFHVMNQDIFLMNVLVGKRQRAANYAELDEEDEMLIMSYVELRKSTREEIWLLDSGCSNHMSGNKLWFIGLDKEFKHSVKLGNNSRMAIMGKGCVKLIVAGVM
jgi:hypothetical protein